MQVHPAISLHAYAGSCCKLSFKTIYVVAISGVDADAHGTPSHGACRVSLLPSVQPTNGTRMLHKSCEAGQQRGVRLLGSLQPPTICQAVRSRTCILQIPRANTHLPCTTQSLQVQTPSMVLFLSGRDKLALPTSRQCQSHRALWQMHMLGIAYDSQSTTNRHMCFAWWMHVV